MDGGVAKEGRIKESKEMCDTRETLSLTHATKDRPSVKTSAPTERRDVRGRREGPISAQRTAPTTVRARRSKAGTVMDRVNGMRQTGSGKTIACGAGVGQSCKGTK